MTNQTWEFREFPGPRPNGEDNAVIFLNEPARQGRGEATATLRNDGSAGLFYLVPGDLGTSTTPTWESREFPSPDGEKNAVIFLNEPARQGPGEATATLRNDGSAGLLYLAPGSLGASTTQTWHFKEFPAPDGVTSALAFLNASPRQGAGEVSGYARNDGSAVIFYLEPGSN
jgi:gentisate 1,2-dioxygenase